MKANIIKYNFLIFSLVLLFVAFYCTVSNAQPSESITRINSECTGNGGTITPASASNTCEFQPDTQKMTFYRLDLCTSRPTGPTTSAQIDRTFCSTFYKNDSGSETTVIKGTGT